MIYFTKFRTAQPLKTKLCSLCTKKKINCSALKNVPIGCWKGNSKIMRESAVRQWPILLSTYFLIYSSRQWKCKQIFSDIIDYVSLKFTSLFYMYMMKVRFMMFNTTFNNISVILWRSVLLVEESEVPRENHPPVPSQWQTLSHNVVSSKPRQERGSNSEL
jgi:hypothetical protein